MKYLRFIRDGKKRALYKKTELFQRLLNVFGFFKELAIKLVVQIFFFKTLKKNSFKVRVKNFCILSGRSRGVYRKFRVSRIYLRSIGSAGLFFGIKKAS